MTSEAVPKLPAPDLRPLRGLWEVFGGRRRPLVLAVVFRAAAACSMGVPVAVMAWCAEAIRVGTLDSRAAGLAVAFITGSVIAQFALWAVANHLAWVSTFHAVGEGRTAALRHVQSLPVTTVSGHGSGEITAVLNADYEQVAVFSHQGLMNLVGGAALPIVTLIGLAVVDPAMCVAVAVSIVAAVPVFLVVNGRFVVQARERADVLAEANGRIIEYVQGIATVRSYSQVGSSLGWYRDAVARMRAVNDALATRITPLAYLCVGTAFLGVPLIIAVAGYGMIGGQVDPLSGVVFLLVVLRVYTPLVQVAVEAEGLRLTDAALRRIARLHELAPQTHPAGPTPRPKGHDVEFSSVSFGYTAGRRRRGPRRRRGRPLCRLHRAIAGGIRQSHRRGRFHTLGR